MFDIIHCRATLLSVLVLAMLPAPYAWAASCCGGGSSASLVLPKFSESMFDMSFDMEHYDGYWDKDGRHVPDPPGSELYQYRLSLGYAKRLGSRWQASVTLPYVWNNNRYAGYDSATSGLGDMSINVWYEAFDNILCKWRVDSAGDLVPATYLGASLTVPTGISPYDNVGNSFDVTGRGFYRLDLTMLLDKTIYPWSATFLVTYGKYLERSVNREYGDYVSPYKKALGDRRLVTLSGGYTHFLESMRSITFTAAYSDLREGSGAINGAGDPATGMRKSSLSLTGAVASPDRSQVYKFTFNHALRSDGWGENFPVTDIFTLGVSYVFR